MKKKVLVTLQMPQPAMERLRTIVDGLEAVIADDHWPVPKYREMLFMF